jgi:hypothetical protein
MSWARHSALVWRYESFTSTLSPAEARSWLVRVKRSCSSPGLKEEMPQAKAGLTVMASSAQAAAIETPAIRNLRSGREADEVIEPSMFGDLIPTSP